MLTEAGPMLPLRDNMIGIVMATEPIGVPNMKPISNGKMIIKRITGKEEFRNMFEIVSISLEVVVISLKMTTPTDAKMNLCIFPFLTIDKILLGPDFESMIRRIAPTAIGRNLGLNPNVAKRMAMIIGERSIKNFPKEAMLLLVFFSTTSTLRNPTK